jgi:DNA-binding response OmpR family regulator
MPTGITILWWPEEGTRLLRLRDSHVPRLVVIKGDMLPPLPLDWSEEEWLRSPFPAELLDVSLERLAHRIAAQPPAPEMTSGDVLSFRDHSVVLPARESVLARVLATAFGRVVPYAALYAALGLDPDSDENAFLGLVSRLRRHLEPIGLEIHAVRRVGYVLREITRGRVLTTA